MNPFFFPHFADCFPPIVGICRVFSFDRPLATRMKSPRFGSSCLVVPAHELVPTTKQKSSSRIILIPLMFTFFARSAVPPSADDGIFPELGRLLQATAPIIWTQRTSSRWSPSRSSEGPLVNIFRDPPSLQEGLLWSLHEVRSRPKFPVPCSMRARPDELGV
ncbi:hypothetical protein PAPYR_6583 [Paratrimastix pyriformis]|uniref:Uncharacterized protein n=1 Tax=Paratrimastix pyriformis TaxID=342808 RepID=A0ABQ8UG78_9EUKA|nr:hypothetical protein PAPYR_6583 [Paratrimastix pyriformis]